MNVRKLLAGFMVAAFVWAAPALAKPMEYALPKVNAVTRESSWKEVLIGGIFLLGCLILAFKPAKRSNLR